MAIIVAYTATILGQKVPATIVGGTADEQRAIRGRLDAAIGGINQHADELSASDAEFSDDPIFPHLWLHYIVAKAPFVS